MKNPMSAVWLLQTRMLPRLGVMLRGVTPGWNKVPASSTKIVLFHIGRSGSTVLGDLLQQDKRFFWDGEVIRQFIRDRKNTGLECTSAYIKERTHLSGGKLIYGCEIKPFHIARTGASIAEFVTELERSGFNRFIVLERRNYLRKIVSSLIAAQTERWHNSSYEKAEHASVTISPDRVSIDDATTSLQELLDLYAGEFSSLRKELADRNPLWMSYEDDISNDPLCAYNKICEFLAIRPGKVTTRYAKTNPWPLPELIDNYPEVCEVLGNTPYTWMTENSDSQPGIQPADPQPER